jgi:hypothetical protein
VSVVRFRPWPPDKSLVCTAHPRQAVLVWVARGIEQASGSPTGSLVKSSGCERTVAWSSKSGHFVFDARKAPCSDAIPPSPH